MSEQRVAIRYAHSLLTLAEQKGVLEPVFDDIKGIEKVFEQNPVIVAVLRNPSVRSAKKLGVLKSLFKGKLNNLTMGFLEMVAQKSREEIIHLIVKSFEAEYEEHKGIQRASVTTTVPLTEALRAKVIEKIKTATGKTIHLTEKVDPELIGGMVITIGDRQWDASLKNKLQRLEAAML